jgi:hypothetical protein
LIKFGLKAGTGKEMGDVMVDSLSMTTAISNIDIPYRVLEFGNNDNNRNSRYIGY